MSKPRTGAIFTQDILHEVTKAMQSHETSEEQADDIFRRKIHALQKFLKHGMSRFSVETLQHVLSSLTESDAYDMDVGLSIRSLQEVRHIVKMSIMKRESGSFRTSDVDSLHYMELFFYCVYCMSEAKRLFEVLYEDLFYSYYNPDGISRQNTRTMSASGVGKRIDGLTEAEHNSQFGISTLDIMTGSTHHKLKQTVEDMRMVLNRWTDLLTENELNPQSFDPESEQDLVRLHGASGIEPVLRLIPDMFAKYYKCLELAKQWWIIAHEIYTGLPFQRRPSVTSDSGRNSCGFSSVTLHDMSIDDENESIGLDNDTESDEVSSTLELIQTLNGEIEVLERREEKFEVLMETYNKVGSDIEHLQAKRNKLLIEQESIKAKGISNEIASIEAQLASNSGSIKLLEFQHALLFEDYVIHLELRPSIIRFLHDAKVQLNDAQHTLMASRQGNKNDESIGGPVSNPQSVIPINRDNHKSNSYHSEYSLQSIEKGVQEVSDRCVELEQENGLMRARKESLSKLNKRHSEQSLKLADEKNNKNNINKPASNKPDYNNNGDAKVKGTKPISKSPKNEAANSDPRTTKRNATKNGSSSVDNLKKENVPIAKRKSVSESQAATKADQMTNVNTKAETSSDKVKSQGGPRKNSDKSSTMKSVQENRGKIHKSQPIVKQVEQNDRNNNPKTGIKVANEHEATSAIKDQERRRHSDSKGSSRLQNTSPSVKENESNPKPRQKPPMSTQLNPKRPRAK